MTESARKVVSYLEEVSGVKAKAASTPWFLGMTLDKYDGGTAEMNAYCSLVCQLRYYPVKVRPDCDNATRNMSRHINKLGTE